MKSLLLVRHAKSSREDASLPDRDRPLCRRGRRTAPALGRQLHRYGVKPDLMISSPALRALETARIIARHLTYRCKDIAVDDRLYPGDARELLEVIRELDDCLMCVMLVGHNPALSELAHRLASHITHLPTCAVVRFTFTVSSWSAVARSAVRHVTLDSPKRP